MQVRYNSSCGPTASTLPSSIKMILSSCSTVEIRWAISRVVLPARLVFRLSRMMRSVRVSTAETATRRKELMRHFQGIDDIKAATVEELSGLPGMNKKAAEQVYTFFHAPAQEENEDSSK